MSTTPIAYLDPRYSDGNASPESWDDARRTLIEAPIFWLSTVRPDGRPHVTPLIAVWHDEALYICTGRDERKWKNLVANDACVLTTGNNAYVTGLDIVVEGHAVHISDNAELRVIAGAFEAKYGSDWHFEVEDGAFVHGGTHRAMVLRIAPEVVFGLRRGPIASQTRWTF